MLRTLEDRITIDANICFGKPCIRGMRYPVTFILDLLASGMTQDEIIGDYPDLETDDFSAALLFAVESVKLRDQRKIKTT